MLAKIADIRAGQAALAGQVLSIDGVLLIADYDRERGHFKQVWLLQAAAQGKSALRLAAISSYSRLWHGLSRLDARHVPGYPSSRVHDAVRACIRVLPTGAAAAQAELLTAAVYRREFTLYVGEGGVSLSQALPSDASISTLRGLRAQLAQHVGKRRHVCGTLVLRSAPPAQYLRTGNLPPSGAPRRQDIPADWLADIEYPQSDSSSPDGTGAGESLLIEHTADIKARLERLPGINQTVVKPAVVVGTVAGQEVPAHFATLTDIERVYLQNVGFGAEGKTLESVLKLKDFAVSNAEG